MLIEHDTKFNQKIKLLEDQLSKDDIVFTKEILKLGKEEINFEGKVV